MNILIIGKSSNIASQFLNLERYKYSFIFTSRNKGFDSDIYLDLTDKRSFGNIPFEKIDIAFIAAGITSQNECETNFEYCRQINYLNTAELIETLLSNNIRVIFPSTNLVLPCVYPFQVENTKLAPVNSYGLFKSEIERKFFGSKLFTVVRISKVLSKNSGLVSEWYSILSSGGIIHAFNDVIISPISTNYVINSLHSIFTKLKCGTYHLSASYEISYYELAKKLAGVWGYDSNSIRRSSIREFVRNKGIANPSHPSLDMANTSQKYKIYPQTLDQLIIELM